jgi:hypothetical protein
LRRNRLVKFFVEEKVGKIRRQGIRGKQLQGDLRERRKYWNFKEEALDGSL